MPLKNPQPVIGIPLRASLPDVPLDLQETLNQVYLRGGYDLDLNYEADPANPLSPTNMQWARQIVANPTA